MRDRIRGDIRKHKEHEAQQSKRQQVGKELVARHELEVPYALLSEEMTRSMRNYARFLASQGVDIEKADLDWEEIGKNLEPDARDRVRRSLILEAIARKEGIEISEVEVDAEIRKAAAGSDQEFAEVRQRLRSDGGYEALRASIAQEKALEMVVEAADVVEKCGVLRSPSRQDSGPAFRRSQAVLAAAANGERRTANGERRTEIVSLRSGIR